MSKIKSSVERQKRDKSQKESICDPLPDKKLKLYQVINQ